MIIVDEKQLIQKIEEKYWLDKAKGAIMPSLVPSWCEAGNDIGRQHFLITDEDIHRGIEKISGGDAEAQYIILLAALELLVFKYLNQPEIVISAPVASSKNGTVANQFFFRNEIRPGMTVAELLDELAEQLLAGLDKITTDLSYFKEKIRMANEDEYRALEKVGFVVNNSVGAATFVNDAGLCFTISTGEKFIEIQIAHKLSKEAGQWITALGKHYEYILKQILVNPKANIGDICVLNENEKKELVFGYNNTVFKYEENTVSWLFENQVIQTSASAALVFNGKVFTYGELNKTVNQLADFLIETYQAGENKVIAVMTERSEWSAIAMLAIIKTGACYLPLDLNLPTARTSYIIQNAKPVVLLTELGSDEEYSGLDVSLPLKKLTDIPLANYNTSNPVRRLPLDIPAFLIYTSGSTGKPKAVVQTHRTLTNLIIWDNEEVGFSRGSSILQYSSFAFDSSLHDIYYALSSGGTAHIVPEDMRLDYPAMADYITSKKISIVSLPFTVMAGFFNAIDMHLLDGHSIQHIISTGEQLLVGARLEQFLAANPAIKLHNFYGPSETHVVTAFSVTGADILSKRVPIGKPVYNSQIYILNDKLELVPSGMTGEIYIGGHNLALGYLDEPELTEQKFINNQFSYNERIYKSGDLGRWLPGEILEYLGRIDHQVKIRGYRVELGEIEKLILKSGSISEALVTERGEGEDKELIAYFVLKQGQQAPDIAASLSETLPSYMIPAYFIQLTEFPLTSNGKLDKKKLPAPVRNKQPYCAPATTEEIILARIWEETLGKTGIGIDDNFFELGGHSLKATRIISGIFKELKRKITLKNIFLFPTIRKLAAFMLTENEVQFYHIPKLALQDSYELSHSQKRIWVIDQFEENSLAYVLPMAFNIKGLLDREAIVWAFEKIIARHESLRTVFINTDGEPRQVVKKPGELSASFRVISISNETNKEEFIEHYLKKETATPFNMENGPLLRGAIIKTGDDKHVLSFTIHHIISDGWSMEIFIKELMAFYNGRVNMTETVLPELRIHYKDFCDWQNKMLTDGSVENDKNYWKKMFEHDVPVLDLPTDHNRMSNQVNAGGAVVEYFDSALVKKIKAFCHEHDISYFIFLAGIIKILLYRYTGQKDIVIGTPVAGRNHPDIEELIGVFINTLPVRAELTQDKIFTDFIKELRDIVTEAYHHQDYPFDKLVDDLNLQRDNTRNPLFDVLVRIDIFDGNSSNENTLEIETINIGTGVSNFDLVFNFELADNELRLLIGYNSGLYKEDTIKRMAAHLGNIATAVTDDAQSRLGFIPYLSQQDHSLLEQFNNTKADFTGFTIDQLATRLAIEIPDNIVIRETERDITFKELRSDSNRIAAFLLASGTCQEEIVAVFSDRGAGMIKLLLGILKANCAYLPIDPDLPEERIQFMLNNAGVSRILLNNAQLLAKYKLDDYQCTVITNAAADLSNYPDNDPALEKNNSQLACIYYTSGSTGKPKGVMLNHAGLVNRVEWFWKNFKCTREDIYLFKTAYTFDVSMSEMFMPICFGCIMMITDDHSLVNPRLLTMAVEKYGITILHFSPTLLNAFLESVDEEDIARMHSARYVLSSGEALPKNLVQKYYRHMRAPIVNLYGPTEASIEVSWHTCSADDEVIPIGKPIVNVGLHILDENNAQVAPGIIGEICISGIALARGYLNNEMMTNERFVGAAINKEKIIVYRTGDRGKWNYKGDVEYLGRNDNQVSIGGYRIELGEIEQNLVEHPSVGNVCVLSTTGKDDTSSLSAYILLKPAVSEIPEIEPVAASKEESVLINNFNTQFICYETTLLLNQLFENVVEKFSGNTAVEFESCKLSYHELNIQANRLAHGLRQRYDIAPEDRIVIMAPRSEKIIIALLAVLKAGAAYVPLDLDYPVERINGIIKDCGSKIVITNRYGAAGIEDENISVIDIDELDITFGTEMATNPGCINIPSHAAYLIYTSGTTGKPKGVIVEHRNICSIAAAWIKEYRLTQFLPRT
ncbi:amino acid adenylation domain-containing protein, partial [Flavitalea sp.]|nr:amino acid adenylation domain-containing protein [Flavitalea sp.]